ncbi:MAG: flagellar basal-body MS-ring/collar protein FliF [Acetobacteraceae bacterium]
MSALIAGLRSLGAVRLAALGAVGAGMLALFALLTMSGGGSPMALLYGDLSLSDAARMTEQLTAQHIPYRLGEDGHAIYVGADAVPRVRVLLAAKGLPNSGSVGFEIFDHLNSLTTSQFVETIDETRALEGELERTIAAIDGVRAVRVNLVLPHRAPFAQQEQPARASILLTMQGAATLDREGVQAILNLAAAAVPGLKPDEIAIVDSRGELLARAGAPLGDIGRSKSAQAVEQAADMRLSRAIEAMLNRTLGPGESRAEATVTMDFDRITETTEQYDPNGQVARSEQSIDSSSTSSKGPQTVTVQNKLPGAQAANGPANGTVVKKREETTNYEISRTVRNLTHNGPAIKRISIAVLVDWKKTTGPHGKVVWQARSPAELAAITALVKSAIGFDAKRGDDVEVASMRFAGADEAVPVPRKPWLGVQLSHADVMQLAKTLLFGVIAVLALLLVLRPMVFRLSAVASSPGEVPELPQAGTKALPQTAGGSAETAEPQSLRLIEDERMIDVTNVEGQLRVSSVRRVSNLVDKHPDETLSIVRGWMAKEAG